TFAVQPIIYERANDLKSFCDNHSIPIQSVLKKDELMTKSLVESFEKLSVQTYGHQKKLLHSHL
ncbi:hypothetical protein EBQ90_09265, partial [bacterium]|nr:hypothetical protein [bacterium]